MFCYENLIYKLLKILSGQINNLCNKKQVRSSLVNTNSATVVSVGVMQTMTTIPSQSDEKGCELEEQNKDETKNNPQLQFTSVPVNVESSSEDEDPVHVKSNAEDKAVILGSDDDTSSLDLHRVASLECMKALLDDLELSESKGEGSRGYESDPDSEKAVNTRADDDDEENMPIIRMNSNIFESQNDDEEEDEDGMDPEAIQSMMEVEMNMDDGSSVVDVDFSENYSQSTLDEVPRRDRPRRQAALIASNTIKKISHLEKSINDREDNDIEYIDTVTVNRPGSSGSTERRLSSSGDKHRCHNCKATSQSVVVVRQYGTDIHLCSNNCFNAFRNPDSAYIPLPCARCGSVRRDLELSQLYYWETMNFCTDTCVGNFQLLVGSVCSTCAKKTPWNCMGKYCVRFGSDIRQFCTATCLELYKKNARVCFHCQLDIKKLGNVVLANIPLKNCPKEFCSQDCVDQYLNQHTVNRVQTANFVICHICKSYEEQHKELVTAIMSYKVCSDRCWITLKEQQMIQNVTKCESCPKFVNSDTISVSPSFYVSSEKKSFGFCSPTCKNVFVLKTRQIKPCTSCQVKKYNYDLIQHPGPPYFAVCSLNCLPKPSSYIYQLKQHFYNGAYYATPPLPTNTPFLPPGSAVSMPSDPATSTEHYTIDLGNGELTANASALGAGDENQEIQIEGVSSLAEPSSLVNGNTANVNMLKQYYMTQGPDGLITRQMTETEIMQLRTSGLVQLGLGMGVVDGEIVEDDNREPIEGEEVDLEDARWGECDDFVVIRHPEPVEQRNKGCQVKPYPNTVECQTDPGELGDMPRIQPKVKVLIVPVPVFIPFPVFTCSQPVPVPYPVGVPVPIPIPIRIGKDKDQEEDELHLLTDPSTKDKEEDELHLLTDASTKDKEEDELHLLTDPSTKDKEEDKLHLLTDASVKDKEEDEIDLTDIMNKEKDEDELDLTDAISPLTPPRPTEVEPFDDDDEVPVNKEVPEVMMETEQGMSTNDLMVPLSKDIPEPMSEPGLSPLPEPMSEATQSPITPLGTMENSYSGELQSPEVLIGLDEENDDVEMMDMNVAEILELDPVQDNPPLDAEMESTSHRIDESEIDTEEGELASTMLPVEMESDPLSPASKEQELPLESEPILVSTPESTQPKTVVLTPNPTDSDLSKNFALPVNPGSFFLGTSSPAPGSPSIGGRGRLGSRAEFGLRAWKLFFGDDDPALLEPQVLSTKLNDWTLRGTKSKGDRYEPDALFYFLLGVQNHIRSAGRPDQIFYETVYSPFVVSLTAYAEQEMSKGRRISKVYEDHIWDANELGPVSPGVLLFTLIYYNYKYFGLKTWEEHGALQFNQVRIEEKKSCVDESIERYVVITGITNPDGQLIEVMEDPETPFRCVVKLLEFYMSKSESRDGSFYKSIKADHEPRGVWYSEEPLSQMDLYRMLVRAQMITSDS